MISVDCLRSSKNGRYPNSKKDTEAIFTEILKANPAFGLNAPSVSVSGYGGGCIKAEFIYVDVL